MGYLSSRIAQTMRDLSSGWWVFKQWGSFGPSRTGVIFAVQDDARARLGLNEYRPYA